MTQTIENMDGYRYIKTVFKNDTQKELIKKLISEAKKIADNVDPHDPQGNLRRKDTIQKRILGALLVRESFKEYINNKKMKHKLDIKIKEISRPEEKIIGKDIWYYFDIFLEVNGKVKQLGFRSSFSYRTSLERLIGAVLKKGKSAFSQIGWYVHSHKSEEKKRDYYVFSIHHKYPSSEILTKLETDGAKVYIAGVASKQTYIDHGHNSSLRMRGAIYRIINPINSVPNPIDVIDEILEIS